MRSQNILWRQVWSISALAGAVVVGFTIYSFYQGQILQSLGLATFVRPLLIFQGLLALLVEPVVGAYSDYLLKSLGSRLPQITLGVTGAGLIFVLLALLLPSSLLQSLPWLVPLLLLLWVSMMIIFRGPVVALLCQLAPTRELPLANSILVVVMALVGAFAPLLEQLLKFLPPSSSFFLGAIILVLGGNILRTNLPYRKFGFKTPLFYNGFVLEY